MKHRDRFLTATAKRLGEDSFFSGAFVVFLSRFCYFSYFLFGDIEIFRIFAGRIAICDEKERYD